MFEEIHKFHGQAHSRLRCSWFNSCCLALGSKVRFVDGGAQQFLLKWVECMKGFSVDIILILSGDPCPPCPREDFACLFTFSWWEVKGNKAVGEMKALSSESLNSIGRCSSPSCADRPCPLTASNLHLHFQQFASSWSPFLMQTPERKLN